VPIAIKFSLAAVLFAALMTYLFFMARTRPPRPTVDSAL
jgi:hypothetical protein